MSSIGRFSASAERQFGIHTTESTESAVVESKQKTLSGSSGESNSDGETAP